jgi:hypothetical protein
MNTSALLQCSVCRTQFAVGAHACPGCGLQLVAQASPVVRVRRPFFSFLSVTVAAIAVFFAVSWIASTVKISSAESGREAFVRDANTGKLSTPAAFESRCGNARWTHQTAKGIDLQYPGPGNDDYFITLTTAGNVYERSHFLGVNSKPSSYRTPMTASDLFSALGCN